MTFAVAISVVFAANVALAKDVLQLIPADAIGFTVVNRLGETDANVQRLGRQMQLPLPSPLTLFRLRSGIDKGLDETAAAAMAVVAGQEAGQPPAGVFFVPVTDYDAFIGQLEPKDLQDGISEVRVQAKPLLVARKDGYAVMARPRDRAALERALADGEQIGRAVADFRSYLDAHDAAVVVTAGGVKLLATLGQHGLEQAKAAVRELGQDENPALAAIDLYAEMLRGFESEVDSLAIGMRLDEAGVLHLTSRTRFNPSGAVFPLLGDAKPYPGDLLAGLPAVPFVGAFAAVVSPEAFGPMLEMSGNMMKAVPQIYGMTPKQVDKMMELSKKTLKGFRGMSFLLGVGRPGDPLYSQMISVIRVDDADAYLANYRDYWKELDEAIEGAEGTFLGNMSLEEADVDGTSALKLTMGLWDGLAAGGVPDPQEFEAIMEKMFGPGGKMTMYLAAADQHKVLMSYTDTDLLATAMRCVKENQNQLSADQGMVKTAGLLPSGAQAVGYLDAGGMIAFFNRMTSLMPKPNAPPQLPGFPESPPIGWAAKASPEGLETHLVVPPEFCRAIGEYVTKVQKWQAELKAAQGP
jgi:hypothetical protein